MPEIVVLGMTFEAATEIIDPGTCQAAMAPCNNDLQLRQAVFEEARRVVAANGRQVIKALRERGFSDFPAFVAVYDQLKASQEERRCGTCQWHHEFIGACMNGRSPNRADFTDDAHVCEEWEAKEDARTP